MTGRSNAAKIDSLGSRSSKNANDRRTRSVGSGSPGASYLQVGLADDDVMLATAQIVDDLHAAAPTACLGNARDDGYRFDRGPVADPEGSLCWQFGHQ